MQYFRVSGVLYVYGYRFNKNTKARNKLNHGFVSKNPLRFSMM